MGHVQPKSITVPQPNESRALHLGVQWWAQIYELLFLFLFAKQEHYLQLSFSNPLWPSASVPAFCRLPLKTSDAGAAPIPPAAAGLFVSEMVGSAAGKSLFNHRQALLRPDQRVWDCPRRHKEMLSPGWAPAAFIMQQAQKNAGGPAPKYKVFGGGAGFQQPSAYKKR